MIVTTTEYFGGCPQCGQTDGCFNIEREHWFKCDTHKTCWSIGANLFSSWREETDADWSRNRVKHESYRTVEPVHPEPTEEERVARLDGERHRAQADAFTPVIRSLRSLGKKWFFDDPFVEATNAAIASILATQPCLVVDVDGEIVGVDYQGRLCIGDNIFDLRPS